MTAGVLPLAGLAAVTVAVVAVSTLSTGSGIGRGTVQRSLATAFAHLYRLQTEQLHRPAVTEARLAVTASCTRGGGLVAAEGGGNDWRCVVSWHLPDVAATGRAIYQLDIAPDGRFVADGDGPKAVNGYFQIRTPAGNRPNPLWQFDGNVDLLTPSGRNDPMQVTRRRRTGEGPRSCRWRGRCRRPGPPG